MYCKTELVHRTLSDVVLHSDIQSFCYKFGIFSTESFQQRTDQIVWALPTLNGTNLINSNSPTTRVFRYSEFQLLTFLPTHVQSAVVQSAARL